MIEATAAVFTPQKIANVTNQRSPTKSWLLNIYKQASEFKAVPRGFLLTYSLVFLTKTSTGQMPPALGLGASPVRSLPGVCKELVLCVLTVPRRHHKTIQSSEGYVT